MNICLKKCLNHYLVHSGAYNSLKSAKNVFFFSFCYCPPPLATLLEMLDVVFGLQVYQGLILNWKRPEA